MQVTIIRGEDSDSLEYQEMLIDGKEEISVRAFSDCPEDAILGRGLISCYEIYALMERAYKAGKNGEMLEFVEETKTKED